MADFDLRALVQLLAPAKALKKEVEKAVELEADDIPGLGDTAARNVSSLVERVATITGDDYIASLKPDMPGEATDRQKLAYVNMSLAQLVAYIQGQVGGPTANDEPKGSSGPKLVIGGGLHFNSSFTGDPEGVDRIKDSFVDMLRKVFGDQDEDLLQTLIGRIGTRANAAGETAEEE